MPKRQEMCKIVEQYIHKHKITGKMPGIIALSKELGLNQVTLFRAFHLLEKKGILSIRGTSGTFVNTPQIESPPQREKHHCLAIIGLNEDAIQDQERRIGLCLQAATPKGFQVINMGLSIAQLQANQDMLGNFPVDGYIFCNSRLTTPHLRFLERHQIPFVNTGILAGSSIANVVDHDHLNGYPIALRHLQSLGHQRIAQIDVQVRPELQEYRQLITQAFQNTLGPYFDSTLLFHQNTVDELEKMGPNRFHIYAKKALQNLLNRPNPPTAIITMATLMPALLDLLHQVNIRVPQDLSLVSVSGSHPVTSETTLFYDTDQVLLIAMNRLIHLVQTSDPSPFCQMVPPVLLNPTTTTGKPLVRPHLLQENIHPQE